MFLITWYESGSWHISKFHKQDNAVELYWSLEKHKKKYKNIKKLNMSRII